MGNRSPFVFEHVAFGKESNTIGSVARLSLGDHSCQGLGRILNVEDGVEIAQDLRQLIVDTEPCLPIYPMDQKEMLERNTYARSGISTLVGTANENAPCCSEF